MWTVTSDYVRGELTYFVEHIITGERKGMFDCQPWAEEFARELNRQEVESGQSRNDGRCGDSEEGGQ